MAARSYLLSPLATVLSVLAACVSESEPLEYPTLVGRFADEGEPPTLVADEAWLSGTDFYVRFRHGAGIRYGGDTFERFGLACPARTPLRSHSPTRRKVRRSRDLQGAARSDTSTSRMPISRMTRCSTNSPGPAAVAELERRLFDEDFASSIELVEPFPERWTDHLPEVLGDCLF